MRITEDEQAFRKKQMLHAAYKLFLKNGIEAVTLAQIAKASHVSINSILRYFGNKVTLVKNTQEILWDEMKDSILTKITSGQDVTNNGLESFTIILANFQDFCIENSEFILFIRNYKSFLLYNHSELPNAFYAHITNPVSDAVITVIERGQADGSIDKNETATSLFLIIWRIMLSFMEELIVNERIYMVQNPWKKQRSALTHYVLKILAA